MPIMIRVGLPQTSGGLVTVARHHRMPVMFSAGALWSARGQYFRGPGLRTAHLNKALDSGGYVRQKSGAYPWSVKDYVELAWSSTWEWWSQMDLSCEPDLCEPQRALRHRLDESAALYRACLDEATRVRKASGPTSMSIHLTDPVPVLQGQHGPDYLYSAEKIAEIHKGTLPAFVGVGSMCTRPAKGPGSVPHIVETLCRFLPVSTRFHLFGIKGSALMELAGNDRIASVDSMAWAFDARMQARRANEPATNQRKTDALLQWYQRQQGHITENHCTI